MFLGANLVECSNLGTQAFMTAETGLLRIRMLSVQSQNTVGDILDCLSNPALAQKYLKSYMTIIQENALDCFKTSQSIDNDFEKWLEFVRELHTACLEQKSSVAEKAVGNELRKATEECRLIATEEIVKDTKKATEQLGKTLDAATNAYQKASDNFPTGWEIIGQQVVSGLADCLTTALNQAIPALVDNMNPIAKAKAAAGLAKGFTGDDKAEKPSGSDGSAAAPSGATQAPQQPPAVEARDPAYAQIARDIYLFDMLNAILHGPDSGIDWESAEISKEKPKSGVAFAIAMLGDSSTSFAKQTSTTNYQNILKETIQVAQEIAAAAHKAKTELGCSKPNKDDTIVKKWQKTFDALYVDTYALNTKGRQLPGNPANSVPPYSAADQTASINAKTQQAQVLLDGASKRLTTTAETLKATNAQYQEASKLLVEQETTLANIKTELEKLTKENMALDEIKSVLVQCIKIIINLKAQITNLVRFFSAIATTVDVVVNKVVTKFLTTVKQAVSSDQAALEKGILKIGNYSLLDAERSMIYQGSLTISAYFCLFADVGTMWRDVSKDYIFPGVKLVEEVGASIDNLRETKINVKKLQDWSDDAQTNIRASCKSKREEILQGMQDRISSIGSTLKQLPPNTVPKQIQNAIVQTTQEVEAAAKKEIIAAAEGKLINRPSMRRKE
ncbi:hypothetical protein GGI43DRAFT_419277 [Trichoderma evansii]